MTTREVILAGALEVLRARGLARATTKEIARASGFSEATLYKLFADQTDLVLCVLAERLLRVTVMTGGVAGLVGKNSVSELTCDLWRPGPPAAGHGDTPADTAARNRVQLSCTRLDSGEASGESTDPP